MHFNGPEYSPKVDDHRLYKQHDRIKALMSDQAWRTLPEIEAITGDPAASISAQLRHLRKDRFGGFVIERRARGDRSDGLFEYKMMPPGTPTAAALKRAASTTPKHLIEREACFWIAMTVCGEADTESGKRAARRIAELIKFRNAASTEGARNEHRDD